MKRKFEYLSEGKVTIEDMSFVQLTRTNFRNGDNLYILILKVREVIPDCDSRIIKKSVLCRLGKQSAEEIEKEMNEVLRSQWKAHYKKVPFKEYFLDRNHNWDIKK